MVEITSAENVLNYRRIFVKNMFVLQHYFKTIIVKNAKLFCLYSS